ncbi:sensor histidine kinase [Gracilibacillus timonensis]|uniref:sensor histidine kinase n=1 Tax=Gracilibacillus timonensis TaxID=1816696 RepID=UPI000825E7BD|nr:HAMP domain-containing sensor histidine kinase [Gracilibacillus timonensis]
MSSWLIIIVLAVLLVISIGRLVFLHWEIKGMTHQLMNIIEHFGTNELVRTNTRNKNVVRFLSRINQLLRLFKQDQQQAQKREKELKQEITNISHDLRTPLTSMQGFTELLNDPSLSEAERSEFLQIIQQKMDHLTMTVDMFYEISQIDSADQPLETEQVSLDQIVIETMLMFYNDFEKSNLQVKMEETPVSPIWADKKAVHRIINNIIQNALRYAQTYFSIDWVEEDDYVRLHAANDITGVNQKDVERMFDRSFRIDQSRADGHLGLGLHIVQQLVDKQGGHVTAYLHENEFQIEVWFRK